MGRWASDAYLFQCLPFQGPSDAVGGGSLVVRGDGIVCVCVCVIRLIFNHYICGIQKYVRYFLFYLSIFII